MSGSLLRAAFEHHTWATLETIDAVAPLGDSELEAEVIGTRGPVLQTIRHVVDGDTGYLWILTQDPLLTSDPAEMPPAALRSAMERNGVRWIELLSGPLDADAVVKEVDPTDGYRRWAPLGLRLAQALQHGTDHRSQVCTTLTQLGIEPPSISVWDFGVATGSIVERYPGA